MKKNTWQLKTVQCAGNSLKMPENTPILSFSDTTSFAGFAGCNRFFGKFKADVNGNLILQLGGTTMMMCPDLEFEDQYLKILPLVKKYSVIDEVLILKDEEGKVELKFSKVEN